MLDDEPRHVVIAGHLTDRNVGDAAIIAGTIRALRRTSRNLRISLLPMVSTSELNPSDTLSSRNEGASVLSPICPLPVQYIRFGPGWRLYWETFVAVVRAVLVLVLLRISPRLARKALFAAEQQSFDAISTSDLVLMKGGSYLRAESRPTHLIHVLRTAFPVMLAIGLGKPVVGMGHSVGPLEPGLPTFILRWVLRRNWRVFPRDAPSRELLSNICPAPGPVIPDCALGITSREVTKKIGRLGLSVRPHPNELQIEDCLVELVQSDQVPSQEIIVIANSTGPTWKEDDLPAASRLVTRLQMLGLDARCVSPSDPDAAIDAYGSCQLVVGMRMHVSILARIGGSPAIPIEYEGHKAAGVYQYLAPDVPIIDVGAITSSVFVRTVSEYWRTARDLDPQQGVAAAADALDRETRAILAEVGLETV